MTDSHGKAVVVILDGARCGALPDAAEYGDAEANTIGNVARAAGGLRLPNLERFGLGKVDNLFAGRGFTACAHTVSNADGIEKTRALHYENPAGQGTMIILVNLDFGAKSAWCVVRGAWQNTFTNNCACGLSCFADNGKQWRRRICGVCGNGTFCTGINLKI